MSGKAAKIVLTEKQQHELTKIRRSTICPQRLIVRALKASFKSEVSSNRLDTSVTPEKRYGSRDVFAKSKDDEV